MSSPAFERGLPDFVKTTQGEPAISGSANLHCFGKHGLICFNRASRYVIERHARNRYQTLLDLRKCVFKEWIWEMLPGEVDGGGGREPKWPWSGMFQHWKAATDLKKKFSLTDGPQK